MYEIGNNIEVLKTEPETTVNSFSRVTDKEIKEKLGYTVKQLVEEINKALGTNLSIQTVYSWRKKLNYIQKRYSKTDVELFTYFASCMQKGVQIEEASIMTNEYMNKKYEKVSN